jgi:hypothetical protein
VIIINCVLVFTLKINSDFMHMNMHEYNSMVFLDKIVDAIFISQSSVNNTIFNTLKDLVI